MPLPTQQRRGLALPSVRTRGGYFASKGGVDRAFGDLLCALFVPRGSRAMRRDFGSGLQRVVFEPVGRDDVLIQFVAEEAAARMVPHVRLRSVKVAPPRDGKVRVHVTFSPPADVNAPPEGFTDMAAIPGLPGRAV